MEEWDTEGIEKCRRGIEEWKRGHTLIHSDTAYCDTH